MLINLRLTIAFHKHHWHWQLQIASLAPNSCYQQQNVTVNRCTQVHQAAHQR